LSLVLSDPPSTALEGFIRPTIYCTRNKYANHYITFCCTKIRIKIISLQVCLFLYFFLLILANSLLLYMYVYFAVHYILRYTIFCGTLYFAVHYILWYTIFCGTLYFAVHYILWFDGNNVNHENWYSRNKYEFTAIKM
jgi:hypothetical protein